MASTAVEAQALLAAEGVAARVVIVSCVRPAPTHDLVQALAGVPLAISIESHYVDGGVGSLTAEVVAENGLGDAPRARGRAPLAGRRDGQRGVPARTPRPLGRARSRRTRARPARAQAPAAAALCMKPGDRIRSLQGPILVLGASGFVGANLARTLLEHRADVVATTSRTPAWRLEDLPARNVREFDALVALNVDRMLDEVRPRTVFNCIAYGAYSFETDGELILRTNLMSTHALLERLATRNIAAYIHAGSSSEYGENAAGPEEHDFLAVNSEYAVSKAACAHLIHYYGKQHGLPRRQPAPVLGLRPARGSLAADAEDRPARRARRAAAARRTRASRATSSTATTSCDAFVAAASELREDDYGDSFNVGTGRQTTIGELAEVARELYGIERAGDASRCRPRRWDVERLVRQQRARPEGARLGGAHAARGRPRAHDLVVPRPAEPRALPQRDQGGRARRRAQHHRRDRLLPRRRGDPGHVPAADRDVRRSSASTTRSSSSTTRARTTASR